MIATKSPLILKSFTILSSNCEFFPLEDINTTAFNEVQDSYPIDLDFEIQEEEASGQIGIFVKVIINSEKKPGYSLYVEGVGFFTFDAEANLPDDEKRNLIQYSGVSISITNLRSYIANMTSYYPFGKYNFPSIDVNDLFRKKADQNNKNSDL